MEDKPSDNVFIPIIPESKKKIYPEFIPHNVPNIEKIITGKTQKINIAVLLRRKIKK
jgi:hypothetical protein